MPFHSYPLAPSGEAWDAGKEMGSTDKAGDWRKMSTIVLDDGTKKGDFKLPHHKGPGGKFATVRRGVANALARCNQVGGASAGDKSGARKHLQKHMAQFKKDYDEAAFTRDFDSIQSFRDGASEAAQESITLRLVEWLMSDSGDLTLLSYARAFNKAATPAVRDEISASFAQEFPVESRKFTNEAANKKLARAQKKLHAAKDEMEDCYKECSEALGQCCEHIDGIMAGGGMKGMAEDTVASKLAETHEKATEVRAETARSQTRLRSHMITAIKCVKDMCDYMGMSAEDDPDNRRTARRRGRRSTRPTAITQTRISRSAARRTSWVAWFVIPRKKPRPKRIRLRRSSRKLESSRQPFSR